MGRFEESKSGKEESESRFEESKSGKEESESRFEESKSGKEESINRFEESKNISGCTMKRGTPRISNDSTSPLPPKIKVS
ncbi:hypothetical protein GLW05_19050 [Pontibacillus yanchengensis]|uniref:Uncharacterized protein n=1 Tax=Pontibacillus yanchengensis TaxID=462910 RepID=A0A6I5A5W9_9BACI|nr:hypothetical protein [Pontibacillus yanchengensis]MYL35679.1 hypothetical protein [Pontibacillus yanchengensis]